jgi:peptidoglycan/LPS O-acetylase OafA/YrhL
MPGGRRLTSQQAHAVDRTAAPTPLGRLYLLDIMRGFAAVSVLLWHYQHFFFIEPGHIAPGFSPEIQPLYALFWPFYGNGDKAVWLFFELSGFVFFYTYFDRIRSGLVSFSSFVLLRFSRLYPLHLLTLVFVLACQVAYVQTVGHQFVYPYNDVKHFALQLFFISNWGFEDGFSFNGPVWSVSVEVMLYIVFFCGAQIVRKPIMLACVGTAIGGGIWYSFSQTAGLIGQGAFCFFAGGLLYCLLARWRFLRHRCVEVATVCFCVVGAYFVALSFKMFQSPDQLNASLCILLFPPLIVLLASLQVVGPNLGRSLRVMGDISYGLYLLHFPMQLFIRLIDERYSLGLNYEKEQTVLLFLALTVCVSLMVHYGFERPSKRYIRRLL